MHKRTSHIMTRSALSLAALVASLPLMTPEVSAGGAGYSVEGGIAARERIRRQNLVTEADQLLNEGRKAYAKGDFEESVAKYRQALNVLPYGPITGDRRSEYKAHLADGSVALAQKYRRVGKYDEARTILDDVIKTDPDNLRARTELEYLDDPIRTNPALTYEHTKNVDKVRRLLYMGEGNFNLGKYDSAEANFEDVIRIDPYNKAARRWLERCAAIKSDYYRAAYDETRARLLMEVDKAWELTVPPVVPIVSSLNGDQSTEEKGATYIISKLREIVIPRIDFEETSLEEAVDFLRQRSREIDPSPGAKGVNFVIRSASVTGEAAASIDEELDAETSASDGDSARINLKLENVPLSVALQYICDQTSRRYKVDDFAVTLVPLDDTIDELITRTWRVPPTFLADVSGGDDGGDASEADPFADDDGDQRASLAPRKPIQQVLEEKGVSFPESASANFIGASSTLVVRNTPNNLDLIDQIVEGIQGNTPKQIKIMTKFVEIGQENSDELGFDWGLSTIGSGNRVFGSGGTVGNGAAKAFSGIAGAASNPATAGLRSGDFAIDRNSIDAILNNPQRTAQASNAAPGILSLAGIFNDSTVQVIMRGLAQKKGSDIMTAPSITARSGQKATIEIIREFIYPTEYEPPEIPNEVLVGGNVFPVTPATPTAFETRNTGVTLEIEPTLGANDYVIDLRFAPEIVEFDGFINYGSPISVPGTLPGSADVVLTENRIEMPVFSSRRVNTSLTIYDGHTVAVGGLMREDVQNVEDKVPILGDIPFIGRLFQSKSENHIKSNMIVFVTARIIDATGRPLRGGSSGTIVDTAYGAVSGAEGGDTGLDAGLLPPL